MKVFHDAASVAAEIEAPWVTIGNFDGVHCGHRLILERLAERAAPTGSPRLAVILWALVCTKAVQRGLRMSFPSTPTS